MDNLDGLLSPALLHLLLPNQRQTGITVGTCTVNELFNFRTSYHIAIPEYQRPYVWQEQQVEKLLQDLRDFTLCGRGAAMESGTDTHYLGTVLLHQRGNTFNIIDGQQRITTLLLINAVIDPGNSIVRLHKQSLELFYEAPASKANIAKNYRFIQEKIRRYLDLEKAKDLFGYLQLTLIVTESADDAFNFFVSQNNRGLSLGATDFLKSFHLRALRNDVELQRILARNFDANNYEKFLDRLFSTVLWRGRHWKGKDVAYEEGEAIRDEFEAGSIKSGSGVLTFYPGRANPPVGRLVSMDNRILVKPEPNDHDLSDVVMPFSLRQPVEEGAGFFLYTEKYTGLYRFLFDEEQPSGTSVGRVQEFYKVVYLNAGMNSYLKSLFRLCIILFWDQFGEAEIYSCALWLDYFLGAYRVMQKSIVAQTPVKICRDKPQNILDIITSAYLPGEVFRFIRVNTTSEDYKTAIGSDGTGVQANYIRCLRVYYKKQDTEPLTDKKDWINDRLQA
ncbi:DUF262 domain-containing protein [Mucilaginibacter angelicae]|uniref:DUF262 domain-containing protein n=1 Tax=Mucilaginibacter angelicae TaxID=869718 RepID=A0ABV6L1A0_9SPHI